MTDAERLNCLEIMRYELRQASLSLATAEAQAKQVDKQLLREITKMRKQVDETKHVIDAALGLIAIATEALHR